MKKKLLILLFVLTNITLFAQNEADIDPTFNIGTGFNKSVYCMKQQPDGKILVGGRFTSYNGITTHGIIRLNIDGTIDNTFNGATAISGGAYQTVFAIELQSDGKIILGGNFEAYTINSTLSKKIIRLNSNGSVDNSFTPGIGFNGDVHSIKILASGNMFIGGRFTTYKNNAAYHLVGLNSVGDFVGHFSGFPSTLGLDTVKAITVQDDFKTILIGNITQYGVLTRNRIIRFNSDFSVDMSFNIGTGFNQEVHNLAIQPNGQIIVVGNFTSYNGNAVNGIVRLNNNGSIDPTFNTGTGFNNLFANFINIQTGYSDAVETVQLQNDGKILIGGFFTTYNSIVQKGFIRLNYNGTKDTTFDIGLGFDAGVNNTLQQADGKFLVVGSFNLYKGSSSNYIARLKGNNILSSSTFKKPSISLYPNPVSEILNLILPDNTTIERYEIYNLLGKKILSEKTIQNNINVSELSNGIYLLKTFTNQMILTNKFIKTNNL